VIARISMKAIRSELDFPFILIENND